jgi:DNA excision repair protein ERCC-6-like 2
MADDQKITWSSDVETSPVPSKRPSGKAKPRQHEPASGTAHSKARAAGPRKSRRGPKKERQPLGEADEANDLGAVVDDDEPPEDALPHYVKLRRVTFDQARASLGRGGLMLPPSYEDLDFSDDERPSTLKRKPIFPGSKAIKPIAPFRDILLDRSGGTIPAPIAQWLRDYQVEGARFLHERFAYQRGCILGDAMGLGKTIQVISFLTAAFGKTGDERDQKRMRKMRRQRPLDWYPRVIIICPGSLMLNWLSELRCWGWWHAELYHGRVDHRQAVLDGAKSGHVEIMITTYTTYKLNMQAVNTVEWDCVVADECHFIKERTSGITRAMNDINALCRIGLTGTPMQNNYDDLWTLFNWANPGKLGALSAWNTCISDPLRTGQSHG